MKARQMIELLQALPPEEQEKELSIHYEGYYVTETNVICEPYIEPSNDKIVIGRIITER